jgi:hypothetical protein
MPTSVHIPKALLDALDRRAKALRLSRNRLIVRALEREVGEGHDWSSGFFDRLSPVEPDVASAADELLQDIPSSRRSKARPKL